MKIDRYVAIAIVLSGISIYFYVRQFSGFDISDTPEHWAQLGDYIGGLLNPILSFISILLLVHSLSLQRESNKEVQKQFFAAQKSELVRAFESKFFGMIKIQSENFSSFALTPVEGAALRSVDAVIWLEGRIQELRQNGASDAKISQYLDEADDRDQMFGLLRGFYVTIKFVIGGLSDDKGFSREDRVSEIHVLINFTDFALVRLCKILMQFSQSHAARYLNACGELSEVIEEVGLNSESY
jgi:hypothetical protein